MPRITTYPIVERGQGTSSQLCSVVIPTTLVPDAPEGGYPNGGVMRSREDGTTEIHIAAAGARALGIRETDKAVSAEIVPVLIASAVIAATRTVNPGPNAEAPNPARIWSQDVYATGLVDTDAADAAAYSRRLRACRA